MWRKDPRKHNCCALCVCVCRPFISAFRSVNNNKLSNSLSWMCGTNKRKSNCLSVFVHSSHYRRRQTISEIVETREWSGWLIGSRDIKEQLSLASLRLIRSIIRAYIAFHLSGRRLFVFYWLFCWRWNDDVAVSCLASMPHTAGNTRVYHTSRAGRWCGDIRHVVSRRLGHPSQRGDHIDVAHHDSQSKIRCWPK